MTRLARMMMGCAQGLQPRTGARRPLVQATKPAYLRVYLPAMPKNHRSPPA